MASSPERPGPDHTYTRDRKTHDHKDSDGKPEERICPFAKAFALEIILLSSVFIDGGEPLVSL
jgi:hypothetical protein